MQKNFYSGIFLYLFILTSSLFGALHDKSAIIYYGENISYPMVGIHDYIIVQPSHINTNSHGFKIYKDKMYAYVSIGEIDKSTKEYNKIEKNWIIAKNRAWSSEVLDMKNVNYQKFIFKELIEPRIKEGFKNFFFDTLDSYQLASKTKTQREDNEEALATFINLFHKLYPNSKLIINRGFEVIDRVHNSVEAVLFESYYRGIGGAKLAYKKVSDNDREWLDVHINKIKSYNLPIICVDYLNPKNMSEADSIVKKIKAHGMIPYIANRALDIYGVSSKNAIKREVFTLIDEKQYDRTLSSAHQYGATVLEYMGYIQKLHDINKGLPKIDDMSYYAGVIIWLRNYYKHPKKLIKWVLKLKAIGIKVVFANNFGIEASSELLKPLGISITKKMKMKKRVLYQDEMIGFEIEPSLSLSNIQVNSSSAEALLAYELHDGKTTVPSALTEWGGYAIEEGFMVEINKDNIWVINPFKFFKEALDLKTLIVPDVTTESGKRLLFSHVDGDGIMNRVEGDFGYYSGDVILNKILKVYNIPHSISVIGAEISSKGLYPKISPQLLKIAKEIYALKNVEPATHTFTHPFFWGKIKNDDLDKKYRLKPKDYKFSLANELNGTLNYINDSLQPTHKAQTVFWSGDCAPRYNALDYIYKHHILNINGGDTTIRRTSPWLSNIAPLGLQRAEYTQVYTGAQNENVFTNDWLGPFWGFKRVVQTFQMTNSPRRFKPIDVYYHLYSGSKQASLGALTYVFDWVIKQDVMPIFTSEYIPKVMDYYTVSIAEDGDDYLIDGMNSLNTIRVEKKNASVDFNLSKSVIGLKHFENHTYISLDKSKKHFIRLDDTQSYKKRAYMISANAKVTKFINEPKHQQIEFNSYVDLKLNFHLPKVCHLKSSPRAKKSYKKGESLFLEYKRVKKALIDINCK